MNTLRTITLHKHIAIPQDVDVSQLKVYEHCLIKTGLENLGYLISDSSWYTGDMSTLHHRQNIEIVEEILSEITIGIPTHASVSLNNILRDVYQIVFCS